MDIALAADERFFAGLWGTAISLLCHTPRADDLTLHVIDCGLSDKSWCRFEKAVVAHPFPPRLNRIEFPQDGLKNLYLPEGKSKIAYARLFFPELFSCDRLLYLDSDLLVFRDIRQLEQIDLDGHAGAAVLNEDGNTLNFDIDDSACARLRLDPLSSYFNTGLFLMNLAYWRDHNLTKECLDYLQGSHPVYVDQTAINVVMNGQITELERVWNRLVNRVAPGDLANPDFVLHYTCEKPWMIRQFSPAATLFEKFCRDTGFDWKKPPQDRSLWERFQFLNVPRGLAYATLSAWHSVRGNQKRARAYADASGYWLEWFANRHQRKDDFASANATILATDFAPEWLAACPPE